MAVVKLGSIRARKDRPGTYEAVYYVNGQRRRVSAESREAVSSAVADLIKESEKEPDYRGAWNRDVTLQEYANSWINGQIHLEPKTLGSYRHLLFSHVLDFKIEGQRFGNVRIRDIRRRHIKALVTAKRATEFTKGKRYANNSVRLMRAVLSSLLSDAMDDEIIDNNPALMLFRKKKREEKLGKQDITPMEESDFQAFVEAAESEKIYGHF